MHLNKIYAIIGTKPTSTVQPIKATTTFSLCV